MRLIDNISDSEVINNLIEQFTKRTKYNDKRKDRIGKQIAEIQDTLRKTDVREDAKVTLMTWLLALNDEVEQIDNIYNIQYEE